MKRERFEVIIPMKIFIVHDLKEAREVMEKYNCAGITIKRIEIGVKQNDK